MPHARPKVFPNAVLFPSSTVTQLRNRLEVRHLGFRARGLSLQLSSGD